MNLVQIINKISNKELPFSVDVEDTTKDKRSLYRKLFSRNLTEDIEIVKEDSKNLLWIVKRKDKGK